MMYENRENFINYVSSKLVEKIYYLINLTFNIFLKINYTDLESYFYKSTSYKIISELDNVIRYLEICLDYIVKKFKNK